MSTPSSFKRSRGRLHRYRYSPMFALVGRCVASWERGRVRIAPWQFESGFGPIFGAPKSGQEKAFGALLRHWLSRQPAVRTATEVFSALKMALIIGL